jgi:hypothetical protein
MTSPQTKKGWIKLYRSLMDKGYYTDSEYVHLWLHLIFKATYQEKEYLFNGKIHHLQPGQFITGRKILAKETGINRGKIERILKTFKIEQQIVQQSFNKFRIISILNWTEYQNSVQQIVQPVCSKCAASVHNQELKKEKKEPSVQNESLEHFISFWKAYPKRQAKQAAIQTWSKLNPSNGTFELILSSIEKQKAYKEHLKKTNQFCPEWPMPATWLNGRRWEDEIEHQGDKTPDNYFSKL